MLIFGTSGEEDDLLTGIFGSIFYTIYLTLKSNSGSILLIWINNNIKTANNLKHVLFDIHNTVANIITETYTTNISAYQ